MPLDPVAQAVADAMSRLPPPDPATLTPAQLRSAAAGMLQPAAFDVPIGSVEDCTIPGPARPGLCRCAFTGHRVTPHGR